MLSLQRVPKEGAIIATVLLAKEFVATSLTDHPLYETGELLLLFILLCHSLSLVDPQCPGGRTALFLGGLQLLIHFAGWGISANFVTDTWLQEIFAALSHASWKHLLGNMAGFISFINTISEAYRDQGTTMPWFLPPLLLAVPLASARFYSHHILALSQERFAGTWTIWNWIQGQKNPNSLVSPSWGFSGITYGIQGFALPILVGYHIEELHMAALTLRSGRQLLEFLFRNAIPIYEFSSSLLLLQHERERALVQFWEYPPSGINHVAHIGGFIGGFILALFFLGTATNPRLRPKWVVFIGSLCAVSCTLVILDIFGFVVSLFIPWCSACVPYRPRLGSFNLRSPLFQINDF
jgi:membrane associated rhomboid family serine protease